jgi:hypothetical protein
VEKEADDYFKRECVDKLQNLQRASSPRKMKTVKWVKVSSKSPPYRCDFISFCYLHSCDKTARLSQYSSRSYSDDAWFGSRSRNRVGLGCVGCRAESERGRECQDFHNVCYR